MGWIAVIVRSLEAFKQTLTDYVGGEAALQALQRQGTAACLQMQPKKKAKKKGSKDAAASADTPPPQAPPKAKKVQQLWGAAEGARLSTQAAT